MEIISHFKNYLFSQNPNISDHTVKSYLSDVSRFINWYEKSSSTPFSPERITSETIKSYIDSLLDPRQQNPNATTPLSTKSSERHLSSLRKFFNYLQTQGYTNNPFDTLNSNPKQLKLNSWKIKEFKNFLLNEKSADLTIKNYINDVLHFLEWLCQTGRIDPNSPELVLTMISQETIDEYKLRLAKFADLSPVSINRKLSSLRKYLSWAYQAGYITHVFVITSETRSDDDILSSLPKDSISDEELLSPLPRSGESLDTANTGFVNAPLRIMLRLGTISMIFPKIIDFSIVIPLVKINQTASNLIWKAQGKPLFKTRLGESIKGECFPFVSGVPDDSNEPNFSPSGINIRNIKKEFYAPLSLGRTTLPFHKNIFYILSHSRPKWYLKYHRYAFAHYLHLAVLIAAGALFAIILSQHITTAGEKNVLGQNTSLPTRLLSFKGKLTNSKGDPVLKPTNLKFAIYSDPVDTKKSLLWSETQVVKPTDQGNFTVSLGQKNPIPQTVANDTRALYIGLSVNKGKELLPRQHLATSAYAADSDHIQGMLPITADQSGTKNVILALDSTGNMTIGGNASPVFQATGGNFTLTGESVFITSNPGSQGNIVLSPDSLGKIDLQGLIQNTSEYSSIGGFSGAVHIEDSLLINATESAQSALIVNQNGTGNLISALSEGIAKFSLSYLGAATFADSLLVQGQNIDTSQTTFHLLKNNVINLDLASSASDISIGASKGRTTINNEVTNVAGNLEIQGPTGINLKSDNQAITFSGNGTHLISSLVGQLLLGSVNLSGNVSLDKNISIVPSLAEGVNNLGSESFPFDNIYVNNIISPALGGISGYLKLANNVLSPTNSSNDLAIGDILSGTGVFKIFGSGTGSLSGTASSSASISFTSDQTYVNKLNGGDISFRISPGGDNGLASNTKLTIKENGDLQITGDNATKATAGSWTIVSDARLKDNIQTFTDGLSVLDQINPVSYMLNGKGGMPVGAKGIGIIAQDVKDIIPYTIGTFRTKLDPNDTSETELYSFNSSALTFVAINAIKELHQQLSLSNDKIQNLGEVLGNSTDPDLLSIEPNLEDFYTITNSDGLPIARIGTFAKIASAVVRSGLLRTQQLLVDGNAFVTGVLKVGSIITGQIISDSLTTNNLKSPVASINVLRTGILSPLSEDSSIDVSLSKDRLTIRNSKNNTPVVQIDNMGNASFSGELRAKKIIADEIEGFYPSSSSATYITNVYNSIESSAAASILPSPTPLALADNSANQPQRSGVMQLDVVPSDLLSSGINTNFISSTGGPNLVNVQNFSASYATVTEGLMVFGPSSFSDVSITSQVSIGGSMIASNNSINVLGSDLELQPLRQGGISFLSGKVTIDIDGNMKVSGNAEFAKDITVSGGINTSLIKPIPDSDLVIKLENGETGVNSKIRVTNALENTVLSITNRGDVVSSGSGVFRGLNIIRSAQADTSANQTVASSSAGTAMIPAGQLERTIITPFVTEDSLIYLTPTSDTQNSGPYIARQTAEDARTNRKGSFTIRIPLPVTRNVNLNWWIIN